MTGRRLAIETFIKRLRSRGAKLMGLEIGKPMEAGKPDLLATIGIAKAPSQLIDLFLETDGVALMWRVEDKIGELGGGFNLLSYGVAMARNSGDTGDEPLEGVLWTGGERADDLALLKRMVIFDSVPGRNQFMTFLIDKPDSVYLVEDGKPEKIHATLDQVLNVLIEYGGASSLREHLVFADWARRLESDPELKRIRCL